MDNELIFQSVPPFEKLPELTMDTDKIWKDVLSTIRVSVSSGTFSTWFAQTFIASTKKITGDRQLVEIACPSAFSADTIEKRYFGLVCDCLNQVTGLKNDLVFVVKQRSVRKTMAGAEPLFSPDTQNGQEEIAAYLRHARVQQGFTFENFAVSSTNQMAHAAAEAICRKPGSSYNPLFLWGGVGVGKTHLMLAIANRVLLKDQNTPTLYCMGEEFTTEIVEAIRNKTTAAFKNKYRKLKLLLIDDIQFIAGKNAVQEEFFHTFNTLQREHGQVVLTSDRHPADIEKFEDRLRSRFEAGLIVDIAPPDFELRTAITLIKARERGIELSMETAQAIAANIESPRRIEGFITRLLTQADFGKEEITLDLVNRLLRHTNSDSSITSLDQKRSLAPQDVVNAVSIYFAIGKRKLLGTNRAHTVAVPRQILMYLLRVELGLPFQEVGRIVGGKDHTTVMYAVEKISKNLSTNGELRDNISGIKRSVSL